jgi:hypothetical protein
MQRRGADALAPALQHGIGAAALAKLGVEPGVRWHLGDAVVDPRVNDAGAVLAGDLAALAVAELQLSFMALAPNMLAMDISKTTFLVSPRAGLAVAPISRRPKPKSSSSPWRLGVRSAVARALRAPR